MKHPKFNTTPDVSKRMGQVHLKGGKAETTLAKALWHEGYRYRRNYKKLPGSPDIAITKYKVAIFVDGEFWHGQDWENRKAKLKSNRESSVSIKKEQDNYIIEGNKLDIDLSNGKKLRLTKKTRTSISITIV